MAQQSGTALVTICLAGLLCAPATAACEPAVGPAAVVLITVDTLRADAVTFEQQSSGTTPYLARLARDAVTFSRAYAPSSWTPPSMASLFTGLYPTSHGITDGNIVSVDEVRQPVLPASLLTLAELFQRAGYRTVGIPSNLHLQEKLGFSQGFDHYYAEARFLTAEQVNAQVRRELAQAFGPHWKTAWRQSKTFLWIHYFDPHDPYVGWRPWIRHWAPDFLRDPSLYPEGLVMRELKERFPNPDDELARRIWPLYKSEVNYLDHHIRGLAEELGLADDDVLFLFTSDHGEEIAEHGDLGHSQSLYQELVRIPFLVRWPRGLPPGPRTVEAPISLLDVFPTLAELAGLEAPEGLHGESLVPLLRAHRREGERNLFFEVHHPPHPNLKGVLAGRWKLIEPQEIGGEPECFDLTADPGERNNLAPANRFRKWQLRNRLHRWIATLPGPPEDLDTTPLDPQTEEELRALGYVE